MDIDGYKGYYQVSNFDRVRSLDRVIKNYPSGLRTMKSVVLKTRIGSTGYLIIDLCKDGKKKGHKIHRLKAFAFIPNPFGFKFINHKDGNKLNNDLSNLEWCNASYNITHAYKQNLHMTKLTLDDIINIRHIYPSKTLKELGMIYNVSYVTIWCVLKGKNCKRFN